jgi:hypothetical protein
MNEQLGEHFSVLQSTQKKEPRCTAPSGLKGCRKITGLQNSPRRRREKRTLSLIFVY